MRVENRLKSVLKMVETGETVVLLARWWTQSGSASRVYLGSSGRDRLPVGIAPSGREKRRFGVLGAVYLRQRDIA